MILALDTTSEFGSIALVKQDALVGEIQMHSTDGFAHVLYGQLEQLLTRHGVALEEIGCFAATAGPGSFTGVRVGLAAMKGLAEATGRKVVAVSNLQAIAWHGSAPLRAVCIDARRGEVYGAVYNASLERVGEETVSKFSAWLATLPSQVEFVSTDFAPFRDMVEPSASVVIAPRRLAAATGAIAWRVFIKGGALDPAAIDANYVRRADAELLR